MTDGSRERFVELIDLNNLRRMVSANYRATGIPTGIIDAETGEIYAGAGWQRICTDYHRKNSESLERCVESDTTIVAHLKRGEHFGYKCKNGLWDIGIPIFCLEKRIATIFLGQFFYRGEVPDVAFFKEQSERFGFDEQGYLSALDEVPVFSWERVDQILEYNKGFAEMLSNIVTNAELVRQKSEEDVRALLNASTESASLIKTDGTFVAMNETTARRLGKGVDELVGKCTFDFLPPDLVRAKKQMIEDVVRTKRPVRFVDERDEMIFYNKISPIVETDGEIVRIAVFTRDVTDSKRQQASLAASEERFRLLAENAKDLVYRYEFVPVRRYVYVSPAAHEMTGYTPEEHYADPDLRTTLIHPADMPLLGRMADDPDIQNSPLILRWIRRDGKILWTEQVITRIVDDDGRLVAIEGRARDITERIHQEQRVSEINHLNERLLIMGGLEEKLKQITSGIVAIFDVEFARIWLVRKGDVCSSRCKLGPESGRVTYPFCVNGEKCLHLVMSSGRYSDIDGKFSRVPFGMNTIGRIASGESPNFVTNSLIDEHDTVDQEWIDDLSLRSFAGFRLLSEQQSPLGVLAMFSRHEIDNISERQMASLANTTSQIIQTAQKEEALREALLKQNEAVRAANIGLWDWNLASNRVHFSAIWKSQIGYEPDEIVDEFEEWRTRVHPDDIESVMQDIRRCIDGAHSDFQTEFRFRHKDGTYRNILAQASTVTDDKGHPVSMIGSHLDITKKRRSEEQQHLQAQIMEQIHDAVISVDFDSRITAWNKGAEQMFLRTKDEALGQPIDIIFPRETRAEQLSEMSPSVLMDGSVELESTLIRANGETFDAMRSISVLKDSNGNFLGVVGSAVDISERKRFERQLKESEHRFRTVVETAPGIILILSSNATILEFNHEAERVLGATRERVLGQNYLDIFVPERIRPDVRADIKKVLKGTPTRGFEAKVTCSDGRERDFSWNVERFVDEAGNSIGVICVGLDISEHKRNEIALSQYAETQAVLLREVNHRVMNNLAAIAGMVHQARRKADENENLSIADLMFDLESRVDGLSTVHGMLSASGWEPLAVTELCEQVAFAAMKGRKTDDFSLAVSPSKATVGSSQAHQLALVINELATNTLKHGISTTAEPEVRIDIEDDEGIVRISYRDNGPGYPERVVRGERDYANIGLALVMGIVGHSLQGEVMLNNNGGAETVIRFDLGSKEIAVELE